jgi:hypothetical protein
LDSTTVTHRSINSKVYFQRRNPPISRLLILLSAPVEAGIIFVYEVVNSSRLITDSDPEDSDYHLVKRYSTEPFSKRKVGSSNTSNVTLSKFDELILETADAHKLDPILVKAIIHVESAFDPFPVSRTGAMGLMQVMLGTTTQYNLIANQFDPQRNVYAGAHHLKLSN